jgi:glycosyltransferase involved in cell wall biosynthesis
VVRRLLAVCRRYQVRIWHGHDYKSNMLGLLLRPFWDMKLVTTAHGWVTQTARTPLYYAVDRWCLPRYHHVICVSADLYAQALKLGVAPERCTLIPNGIDERTFCRRFPAAEAPLRARFRVPAGRLVVGAAGRLSPEKAFNNLIHAVHHLVNNGFDLELWIAGAGAGQAELEALVARLGLGERVRLLGFVEDTIGFYHGLDLFVLSSLREGLPNVVLEAMAMGVPVVAARVAGVPALIEEGRNGLLCPPGDIAGLAGAMRRAAEDPAWRAALAQAGRQTIEERWTFGQRMARERLVYDELLSGGGERGSAQAQNRG